MEKKEIVIYRGNNPFCEKYAKLNNLETLILEDETRDQWEAIIRERLQKGEYSPITDITTNETVKAALAEDYIECLYQSYALGRPEFREFYMEKLREIKQAFPKVVAFEERMADHFFTTKCKDFGENCQKSEELTKILKEIGIEVSRKIDWNDPDLVVLFDHHADRYIPENKKAKAKRFCPCCITDL